MVILITGVNGYIGKSLFFFLQKKYPNICGVDKKIDFIRPNFYKCNLNNKYKLQKLIKIIKPTHIIHLAGESLVDNKINKKKYYINNIIATRNLIFLSKKINIKKIIFASTASVYKSTNIKLKETSRIDPISNYSKSKLVSEQIIKKSSLSSVILRFFNVCSSIKNLEVGELHNPETHLIPTLLYKIIFQIPFYLYGSDYSTKDGSCIRDYIHIEDICVAIDKSLFFKSKNKFTIFNLGNGKGFSIFKIIKKSEKLLKKKLKIIIINRRLGDTASLVCDNSKARKYLKWYPIKSSLQNIIKDEVSWIKKFSNRGIKRVF